MANCASQPIAYQLDAYNLLYCTHRGAAVQPRNLFCPPQHRPAAFSPPRPRPRPRPCSTTAVELSLQTHQTRSTLSLPYTPRHPPPPPCHHQSNVRIPSSWMPILAPSSMISLPLVSPSSTLTPLRSPPLHQTSHRPTRISISSQ